jgi:hypothetical protein
MISPSAGTLPPERTSTTSPLLRSPKETVSVPPSTTRSASSGRSSASASSAPDACPTARISSQWPSSIIVTRRASSHQKSRSKKPNVVAALATNATIIAMAMRSIMPGCLDLASSKPPLRNGQPPQVKMKVPRTGATHPEPENWGAVNPSHIWIISL